MDTTITLKIPHIHLDPRTKLFMVFVVSSIVLMTATTPLAWVLRIMITLVPLLLLFSEGRGISALCFGLLYTVALLLMKFFLSTQSTGVVMALLTGYCGIVVQFLPAMITAWYLIRTTQIGEFLSAMQKMHIPDGLAISLAVLMRFFPTIKEEYGGIRDAMKMRGIMLGGGHASKMIEYRLIPLLFSCVSIGDELSAAAITRGLGGNKKRSSATELKLTGIDLLLMALFAILAVAFIIAKYL